MQATTTDDSAEHSDMDDLDGHYVEAGGGGPNELQQQLPIKHPSELYGYEHFVGDQIDDGCSPDNRTHGSAALAAARGHSLELDDSAGPCAIDRMGGILPSALSFDQLSPSSFHGGGFGCSTELLMERLGHKPLLEDDELDRNAALLMGLSSSSGCPGEYYEQSVVVSSAADRRNMAAESPAAVGLSATTPLSDSGTLVTSPESESSRFSSRPATLVESCDPSRISNDIFTGAPLRVPLQGNSSIGDGLSGACSQAGFQSRTSQSPISLRSDTSGSIARELTPSFAAMDLRDKEEPKVFLNAPIAPSRRPTLPSNAASPRNPDSRQSIPMRTVEPCPLPVSDRGEKQRPPPVAPKPKRMDMFGLTPFQTDATFSAGGLSQGLSPSKTIAESVVASGSSVLLTASGGRLPDSSRPTASSALTAPQRIPSLTSYQQRKYDIPDRSNGSSTTIREPAGSVNVTTISLDTSPERVPATLQSRPQEAHTVFQSDRLDAFGAVPLNRFVGSAQAPSPSFAMQESATNVVSGLAQTAHAARAQPFSRALPSDATTAPSSGPTIPLQLLSQTANHRATSNRVHQLACGSLDPSHQFSTCVANVTTEVYTDSESTSARQYDPIVGTHASSSDMGLNTARQSRFGVRRPGSPSGSSNEDDFENSLYDECEEMYLAASTPDSSRSSSRTSKRGVGGVVPSLSKSSAKDSRRKIRGEKEKEVAVSSAGIVSHVSDITSLGGAVGSGTLSTSNARSSGPVVRKLKTSSLRKKDGALSSSSGGVVGVGGDSSSVGAVGGSYRETAFVNTSFQDEDLTNMANIGGDTLERVAGDLTFSAVSRPLPSVEFPAAVVAAAGTVKLQSPRASAGVEGRAVATSTLPDGKVDLGGGKAAKTAALGDDGSRTSTPRSVVPRNTVPAAR